MRVPARKIAVPWLLALLLSVLNIFPAIAGSTLQENPGTIVEVASSLPEFSTLVSAITAADLVETLSGEGPFTVFAPTNDAFAKLPEADLNALLADKEALTRVLTYHVVAGTVLAEEVVTLAATGTVEGSNIDIEVVDGDVILNGSAKVTATDVAAGNGVIHVIDSVLLPPALTVAAADGSEQAETDTSEDAVEGEAVAADATAEAAVEAEAKADEAYADEEKKPSEPKMAYSGNAYGKRMYRYWQPNRGHGPHGHGKSMYKRPMYKHSMYKHPMQKHGGHHHYAPHRNAPHHRWGHK